MSKGTRDFIEGFNAVLSEEMFMMAEIYWEANDPEGDGVYIRLSKDEVEKCNFQAGKEIGAIIKRELQKSKHSALYDDFDREITLDVALIMDGIKYGLNSY